VCMLGVIVLFVTPLKAAFGFPMSLDARWIVASLSLPAAWSCWQLLGSRR